MPKRSLSLRREALAELSPDDLARMAAAGPTAQRITCPLTDCVLPSGQVYCWSPSFLDPCTD